jgi:hypothetical protein
MYHTVFATVVLIMIHCLAICMERIIVTLISFHRISCSQFSLLESIWCVCMYNTRKLTLERVVSRSVDKSFVATPWHQSYCVIAVLDLKHALHLQIKSPFIATPSISKGSVNNIL